MNLDATHVVWKGAAVSPGSRGRKTLVRVSLPSSRCRDPRGTQHPGELSAAARELLRPGGAGGPVQGPSEHPGSRAAFCGARELLRPEISPSLLPGTFCFPSALKPVRGAVLRSHTLLRERSSASSKTS